MTLEALFTAAATVRQRAHAPHSNFKVGAALQAVDGSIFLGCNVESASYGLTCCAERVAAFRAIADGAKSFSRIAIIADTTDLTPPCGACRQVLWDICGNIEVYLLNLQKQVVCYPLGD
ncbi:MAG: cytidine deaminase, partial [Gemmataceae bacterium]